MSLPNPLSGSLRQSDLVEPNEIFNALLASRGGPAARKPSRLPQFNPARASEAVARRGRIEVVVAQTHREVGEAINLVRDRYEWRGYAHEHVGAISLDPMRRSCTLVAREDDNAVGTLTLEFDGPKGLLIDQDYPLEVSQAREQGRRVCELTRLALAERIDTKAVLSSLFGMAYALGRALHDVTDVFIEVNPRHVAFYRKVLGFVVAAGERLCVRVNAPSVLLCLELNLLEARLFDAVDATRKLSEFAVA